MFVELSYSIGAELTVMDENLEGPQVISRSRICNGQKNNTSYLHLFAHTGTHIDVPWHFNENGRQVLDFEIGEFVFWRVLLVDIITQAYQPITLERLESLNTPISKSDALLIRTGFSRLRKENKSLYIHGTPGLDLAAAEYLAGFPQLRCIGVDFISIENIENARPLGYPVHHILLGRDIPMILLEDAKLQVIKGEKIHRLFLFPLRIEGLEASPVTAVAEILEE